MSAPARSRYRALLDWRLLLGIGAAAAAAGAAAAIAMRRRYASATADAENDTTVDAPDREQADGSAAHSEVNGRVATPGADHPAGLRSGTVYSRALRAERSSRAASAS